MKDAFVPHVNEWMPPGAYNQAALRYPWMFLSLCPAYLGLTKGVLDVAGSYLRGELPGQKAGPRRDHPVKQAGWATMNLRYEQSRALLYGAIDHATLDPTGPPTEPGTAREVLAALAAGEGLVVSSSMPIRDLEWYGRPRGGVRVVANRGANGIDGVVATAWGVALGTGTPVAVLIGDVALLHDSSSLTGLAASGVDLALVVVDNDGGGIFSFLPQATDPGGAAFEALFGTPHGVDLPALAGAHGIRVVQPATAADVGPAVRGVLDAGGVGMVHVRTDRSANVEVHRRIHDAVAAVLRD